MLRGIAVHRQAMNLRIFILAVFFGQDIAVDSPATVRGAKVSMGRARSISVGEKTAASRARRFCLCGGHIHGDLVAVQSKPGRAKGQFFRIGRMTSRRAKQ